MPSFLRYSVYDQRQTNTSALFFARRGRKRYVIKEFKTYRFCDDTSGEPMLPNIARANHNAEVFFEHQKRIAERLRKTCRQNGPVNIPIEVFRKGVCIYKVTRLVESCGVKPDELRGRLSAKQMIALVKSALLQLDGLRRAEFAHCDIKPDNLVIAKRGDVYTCSLIDFDSGLILSEEPTGLAIEFTPEYASPELMIYQQSETSSISPEERRAQYDRISSATDVFSMGCVLYEYLTGHIPGAALEGGRVMMAAMMIQRMLPVPLPGVNPLWRALIKAMLRGDPQRRPTALRVLDMLDQADRVKLFAELDQPLTPPKGFERLPEAHGALCSERMALVKNDCETFALWFVEGGWLAETPLHKPLDGWSKHNAAAAARRARIDRVNQTLSTLHTQCAAIKPSIVYSRSRRLYALQPLPKGSLFAPCDAPARGVTARDADRIMVELALDLRLLHEQSLVFCGLPEDSVLLYMDDSGLAHPVLTALHDLIPLDDMPDPDQIHLSADRLAPEVCLYLGMSNLERALGMRSFITQRADLFCLGILYHELLSGQKPAIRLPMCPYVCGAVMFQAPGQPALRFDPCVEPWRAELIDRMLCYEPSERLPDCDTLIQLITKQSDERAEPEPPPPAPPAPPADDACEPVPDDVCVVDLANISFDDENEPADDEAFIYEDADMQADDAADPSDAAAFASAESDSVLDMELLNHEEQPPDSGNGLSGDEGNDQSGEEGSLPPEG